MDGGAIDIGIHSGIYGGTGSILACNEESFCFRNKRFILEKKTVSYVYPPSDFG